MLCGVGVGTKEVTLGGLLTKSCGCGWTIRTLVATSHSTVEPFGAQTEQVMLHCRKRMYKE